MKIKVIGKEHAKGVAKKTNKPYDFVKVYYIGKSKWGEGQEGKSASMDPDVFPYPDITIGGEYNVEFDEDRNVVDFTPVSAPAPAAR